MEGDWMTLDQGNARKMVLGALLIGASALPAGGVISGLLAGVGANWVSEAVGGVVGAGPPPGQALSAAFARAVQIAVKELRQEYGDTRIAHDGQDAFKLLRDTARSTTTTELPPGTTDIAAVQRGLAGALNQLLIGYPDAQVKLLRERLLPATARAFQEELARDPAAWRLYHGWLLERLMLHNANLQVALAAQPTVRTELADAAALGDRLDGFAAQLDALLAELREALLRAASLSDTPIQQEGTRQLAEVGDDGGIEDTHQRVENTTGPVEQSLRTGHGGTIKGNSQVVIGKRHTRDRSSSGETSSGGEKTRDPPPIVARLTLRPNSAGAEIDWEAPILGKRTSHFALPYAGEDLGLVIRALDLAQYPSDSLSADEARRLTGLGLPHDDGIIGPAIHRAVGRALFDALNANPVATTALSTLRSYATAEGRALSLHLHFPGQAAALAALPWELLWPAEPRPLLLSGQGPLSITRHLDLDQALPKPRLGQRPLRVRAIVPRAGLTDAEHEAEQIVRREIWKPLVARGDVTLLPDIRPATRSALTGAARREPADILHFIGHGRVVDEAGHLVLDGEAGRRDVTPISRLLNTLADARLAVFSACQGAAISAEGGETILNSVAAGLSAAGVPLVLGMQLTVRVEAASRICGLLFAELARGRSIQAALWAVRSALFTEEPDGASWYVPALYVRAAEDGEMYLFGQE